MDKRPFWPDLIEKSWKKKSLLWLSGLRRSGKTTLCKSLDQIEYFDCESPKIRARMEDPENFLSSFRPKTRLVLDEVHRLSNPAELLKIAADHFPQLQVLATGSSTLHATAKFRDSLTGRKTNVWLTPILVEEIHHFHQPDLSHRMLYGGLPPFFLGHALQENDFQEWLDAFWAKDIQELFRLERRYSFVKFMELLLQQSGGIFEATSFAAVCEVSRPTIQNYLSVLEETYVAHILRPYNTRKTNEILSAPKVYGFDTGFVCFFKGWDSLRTDDYGLLWEHLVLNEIQGKLQTNRIHYWRDKQGHEMDIVIAPRGKPPIAIECKYKSRNLEPENFRAFRRNYPKGKNYVVSWEFSDTKRAKLTDMNIQHLSLADLVRELSMSSSTALS